MNTFTGTLKSLDFGTGGWALCTNDGEEFTLRLSQRLDATVFTQGTNVVITAHEVESNMGFLMANDKILDVNTIERTQPVIPNCS